MRGLKSGISQSLQIGSCSPSKSRNCALRRRPRQEETRPRHLREESLAYVVFWRILRRKTWGQTGRSSSSKIDTSFAPLLNIRKRPVCPPVPPGSPRFPPVPHTFLSPVFRFPRAAKSGVHDGPGVNSRIWPGGKCLFDLFKTFCSNET